ncbi:carboxypeptidase regulatory-like domain-containing protein [Lignipirellula cremea]|uniref:Blue (type 1) copper domain-containing protein n=1 Tax=Lignipirellula cremea TaxID=2528010 RepID=A0A518DU06_9BACT|nr:carboxypeptidase regulatory-like domain-containing protein [Lignipirellula cremea]QDU95316.1 hypothetical protein Pla8534_31310 [Lignipirellula cremea]
MRLSRSRLLQLAALACFLFPQVGCSGGGEATKGPGDSSTAGKSPAVDSGVPATPDADEAKFWEEADPGDPEWGTLRLRFVLDGPAPKLPSLNMQSVDAAYCSTVPPPNEKLIVNPDNGGVKNVVVWLYNRDGDPIQAHPDYAAQATGDVFLENKNCRFEPHIRTLQTGQRLVVRNLDKVGHNTKVDLGDSGNPSFNRIVPVDGQFEEVGFTEAMRAPYPVLCTMHGWMNAHLLIQTHPYMAVSDADGRVEIKNLPPGDWTFQVWHESPGYVTEGLLNGQFVEWKRGRFTETVKPGVQNKGKMSISRGLFEGL